MVDESQVENDSEEIGIGQQDECVQQQPKNEVKMQPGAQNEDTPQQTKTARKFMFREKQFTQSSPVLEKLFDVDEGEGAVLFNFFVAFFVLSTMGAWTNDYRLYGNPLHHFWLIAWNFEQLPATMLVWTAMFLSSVAIPFYALRTIGSRSPLLYAALYCVYQLAFFFYSIRAIFWLRMHCACSFIITCENTRIAMKSHSFVRENFGRALKLRKSDAAKSAEDWPSLGQFLYFMFCPSFLYRDAYPRSPNRSWRKVLQHLAACLASIYLVSLSFSQCIIPLYEGLSYPADINWRTIAFSIFPSVVPGSVCLFLGIFYGLLHSWLSMFAEALRFGDRHFYSNWWSSRNMAEYYRNWNLVVHEWLYAYIYRDLTLLIGGKWGARLAQTLVFFFSALFHEYWFCVSLRMVYPVIFTSYFIFGGIFFLFSRLIKRPFIWNILMWWNLLIGTGIFAAFYGTEWYARLRCERVFESDWVDIVVPRSWTCHPDH